MFTRFEQFSATISAIFWSIQKIEREEMEKGGYKGAFAQYLAILYHHPQGLTAAGLCELSGKDKAAISRILQEMAEKGLVDRGTGKYRALVTLTPAGRAAAEYVRQRAQAAVAQVGNQVPEGDRAVMYQALSTIARGLQTLCQQGIPMNEQEEKT